MADTSIENSEPIENVETSETIETSQEDDSFTKTSEALDVIIRNLDNTLKTIKGYMTDARSLKKEVQFLEKTVKKLQTKKNRKKKPSLGADGEKRKNGFARPTDISTQLADFLGVEHGQQIARTEVTKKINSYIKEHELQDPDKKKRIRLESEAGIKLKNLLTDVIDNDGQPCDLDFINIQKYIKHHFPKKGEATTPVEITKSTTTEETPSINAEVGIKKKVKKPIRKKELVA